MLALARQSCPAPFLLGELLRGLLGLETLDDHALAVQDLALAPRASGGTRSP